VPKGDMKQDPNSGPKKSPTPTPTRDLCTSMSLIWPLRPPTIVSVTIARHVETCRFFKLKCCRISELCLHTGRVFYLYRKNANTGCSNRMWRFSDNCCDGWIKRIKKLRSIRCHLYTLFFKMKSPKRSSCSCDG